MQRNATLKRTYIPGIDGLRAVAVLSVIAFHFAPFILPGGFSGVDVFFVISGYVVSCSLAREARSTFANFIISFYARRITRIYPALLVCIVLISLAHTLVIPSSWLSTTSAKTAISAFFGLSNFALVLFNDGYFSPRVEFNAFTHTWSLAVEEQFYLLFPIVFFVWLKGRERNSAVGIVSNWLLAGLLVTSLLYSWHETSAAPDHAYYLLPSRFWELACGAMLFKLQQRDQFQVQSETGANISITTGLILIGIGFALSDPQSFPFPWALLSVSGALLVIAGVTSDYSKGSLVAHPLENGIAIYIGKLSYSLYLWHWPILVLFRWTVGLESLLSIILALALTILMSTLSYHFIEKPIRRSHLAVSQSDWQIVLRGGGLIVFCATFAGTLFLAQPYLSLSVTKDKYTWYPKSWPSNSQVILSQSEVHQNQRIFVLGDSHTGAYSTMLQKLTDEQGVKVYQYSKAGCPIANLLSPPNSECAQFIQETLSEIEKRSTPGDIVFLASLRMKRLMDQWRPFSEAEVVANQLSSEAAHQRMIALQDADKLITRLERASLSVVIDAPKPVFKSPPYRCSDWFNSENPICVGGFTIERSFLLEHRKFVMESIEKLKLGHPNLVVWDTFPTLCRSDVCSAFDKGKPLFFDGDHLSAYGNRVLYPSFLSVLTTIRQKGGPNDLGG